MGTWGSGPFDGDTAMDFADEVVDAEAEGIELVVDVLRDLAEDEGDDDIEAPDAEVAVAAAAIVAAARGHAEGWPEELADWVREYGGALIGEAPTAAAAVDRVLRGSELRDLWLDGSGAADWEAAMALLRSRLD